MPICRSLFENDDSALATFYISNNRLPAPSGYFKSTRVEAVIEQFGSTRVEAVNEQLRVNSG